MVEVIGRLGLVLALVPAILFGGVRLCWADGVLDQASERAALMLQKPETLVASLDALDLKLLRVAEKIRHTENEADGWRAAMTEARRRSAEIQARIGHIETSLQTRLRVRRALKLDSVELRQLIFSRGTVNDLLRQRGYLSAILRQEAQLAQQLSEMALNAEDVEAQQRKALREIDQAARALAHQKDELEQQRGLYFEVLRRLRQDRRLAGFVARHRASWKRLFEDDNSTLKPPSTKLPWPTNGRIARGFGRFTAPQSGAVLPSNGWTIMGQRGQGIRAMMPAHVLYTGVHQSLGRVVILEHSDRVRSVYVYSGSVIAQTGTKIRGGQLFGRLAEASDVHQVPLYFELRVDGRTRDPAKWLRKKP
ncbi:MAG: peptidoglycan DD-metalloendopeptidase family protein [Myxococcota bacterium]|nr:peptidoglycan DD-metalloendopeptidase family protein [Myxococcota bacterium]